jgi:WD40 repeat protein
MSDANQALPQLTPAPTATFSSGGGTGKILYRLGQPGYGTTFFELDLQTGSTTRIPVEALQIALHPDGEHLVGTQVQAATSGLSEPIRKPVLISKSDWTMSPIPNIETGFDVSASPDGRQIVYVVEGLDGQNDQIWVANLDGINAHSVSDSTLDPKPANKLWLSNPTWSPDGTRIAYTANGQLRVIDLKASTDQVLFEHGYATAATWSPDGQSIAYLLSSDGRVSDLYVANADGSSPRLLFKDGASGLAWSPDSSRIVLGLSDKTIYTLNADGSNLQLVWASAYSDAPTNFVWELLSN